jgi:pyrroloquinoline quinone biosynthesis protein D
VVVLNATGAAIIERCDGERTVAAIAEELSGRYDRDVAEDVCGFVARLVARRWLEAGDG